MNELKADLPEEEYFATPAASNSTLSRMKRSPAHCKAYMDEGGMEPTPNMRFGSLVHCLVLEPALFASRYHVADEYDPTAPRTNSDAANAIASMQAGEFELEFYRKDGSTPKKPREGTMTETIADRLIQSEGIETFITEPAMNKRTKEGKAQFAEFQAKCEREGLTVCKQEHIDAAVEYADYVLTVGNRQVISESDYVRAQNYVNYLNAIGGREVITEDVLETANAVAASIMAHDKAAKLLTGGNAEQSVFWEDSETGYQCKGRIDFLRDDAVLVDLKTTQDASLEEFARSVWKFGYHRQCAMYKDGYEAVTGSKPAAFVFIAVETKPPYAVGVYMLDDESEEKGRAEYKGLLSEFVECKSTGVWPAYSENVEILSLPAWAKYK